MIRACNNDSLGKHVVNSAAIPIWIESDTPLASIAMTMTISTSQPRPMSIKMAKNKTPSGYARYDTIPASASATVNGMMMPHAMNAAFLSVWSSYAA